MKVLITWAIMSLCFLEIHVAHALEELEPEIKQEVTCLAKNIYYEAGLEHYEGQLAVAQVTINRSEHDSFPDSICGVVYHKTQARASGKTVCQFSWVCESNRRKIDYSSIRWYNSVQLAKDVVVEGLRLDHLSDALFFHNTHVNPNWGLQKITKIGGHIFYNEQRVKKR